MMLMCIGEWKIMGCYFVIGCRPSREKALKLSVIGLTSQADVLRSSSRVPAPPTSAETSGYKRTLNIFSMLSPLVGILQQEG